MNLAQFHEFEAAAYKRAKSPDTNDNFEIAVKEVVAAAEPLIAPLRKPWRPKVAFLVPSAYMLAHVVNLHTLLRGLDQIGQPFDVYVLAVGGSDPSFVKMFTGRKMFAIDSIENLQNFGHQFGLDALIYVSVAQLIAITSGIRCARKHVWWSHKWKAAFPHLDGYINACDPLTKGPTFIRGAYWHNVYSALPEMYDPSLSEEAKSIRDAFGPETVVYGAFGRNEKFSREFVGCIGKLLDAEPNARVMYATRRAVEGMHERAQFVGWVNTRLWAQVIDVMLDTFPFPGGHTTFEAMACSKPVVFYDVPRQEQLWPAEWRNATGLHTAPANSTGEYVEDARRFMNEDARTLEGASNRSFFQTQCRDEQRMAREFVAALQQILV